MFLSQRAYTVKSYAEEHQLGRPRLAMFRLISKTGEAKAMFLLLNVHVLIWTTVVKYFTAKRTQARPFIAILFTLWYCSEDLD